MRIPSYMSTLTKQEDTCAYILCYICAFVMHEEAYNRNYTQAYTLFEQIQKDELPHRQEQNQTIKLISMIISHSLIVFPYKVQ